MLSTLVHIKDKNELKNHCAFCFSFQLKPGFDSTGNILWGSGGVWPPCCLPLEPSVLLFAVETHCSSQYYSLNTVMQNLSCSLPPSSPHHQKSSLPYFRYGIFGSFFGSHLTLRTWSVFLILTKINLLFSCWILSAYDCCDSHTQIFHVAKEAFIRDL